MCVLTWGEHFGEEVTFTVPESIDEITILVAGATGGDAGGQAAMGGAGTLAVTTLDMSNGRDFSVWLGDDGDDTRHGWSDGGAGADGPAGLPPGGGGGGSTGIAYTADGHDNPFLVASGGGGGGGLASIQNGVSDGGGIGGQGGTWGGDGETGHKGDASDGRGGVLGGATGVNGGDAYDGGIDVTASGGGGGGGGWPNGGEAGESGGVGTCNERGKCPPDAAAGAGGGGGAGVTSYSGIPAPYLFTAPRGDGFVVVYAGSPIFFECRDSNDPRFWDVPDGLEHLGVLAVGGQGQQGSNDTNSQGVGGLVTGMIDVSGISRLEYFVGCSGDSGGWGFGQPGSGGSATLGSAMQGGDGGGATTLSNGDDQGTETFFAAGGGGGAGGNAACADGLGCKYHGGRAGSSGGTDGTYQAYNGQDGEGFLGDDPSGGCAACMPGPDGNSDTDDFSGGGGGGGGAGFPYGGQSGDHGSLSAGGGGGAGASYLGQAVVNGMLTSSGWQGDGLLMLIPLVHEKSTLTVSKQVTGNGTNYADGPFVMDVSCSVAGAVTNHVQFALEPSGSHDVPGIPVGAECTVTEFETGGATVPASPANVTIVPGPNSVVMTNEFELAPLEVSLTSVIDPADSGTEFTLGTMTVAVVCSFLDHQIPLPPPAQQGYLTFDGQDTWSGTSQTVDVPVGARCFTSQTPPLGNPEITYTNDDIVVVPEDGAQIGITDTYTLTSVSVTKAKGGAGTAPDGLTYPISLACTFGGEAVTLAASQVELAIDGEGSFASLPQGAECTVTEDDRQGATAVQYSPARTFTVSADTPALTVTNLYEDDQLHVVVSTSGSGASWANTDYSVSILCSLEGEVVFDETVSVPPVGGVISRPVDAGAECLVEETVTGGATEVTYPLGTSVTMPDDGGAAGLEIENRFDVAPLVITSTNTGPGAGYANIASEASVGECFFNSIQNEEFSATVPFGIHGGAGTVNGIVVGANCDVVQSVEAGGTTTFAVTDGDPSSDIANGVEVTINSGSEPTTVAITNDFELGALTVTKSVTGDASYAANTPYRVEVQCTFNGLPVHRLGPDGIATIEFDPDGTLRAGYGATQLETLVAGTLCSAVETESGGATTVAYAPEGDGRSAEVAAPGTITVTNTFDATSLTVTKALGGNNADAHADDVFWFDQACTFNGQPLPAPPSDPQRPKTFSLTNGTTQVFGELPVGAECDVREFGDRRATFVEPAADQTITLGSDDANLMFTNVFDVVPVLVHEDITGAGAQTYGLPQTYLPKLLCSYPDGSRVVLPDAGVATLDLGNAFSQSIEVPANVTCGVTQPNTAHATEVTYPPSQDVVLGDSPQVTVTSQFDLASIDVSKVAYGQFPASTEFGFTTECTWTTGEAPGPIPVNEPGQAAFDLRSGQSMTVQALVGADCTVVETDSEGALRVVVTATGPNTSLVSDGASAHLWPADDVSFEFENFMTGSLPVTGAELRVGAIVLAALILAGLGVAAVMIARRRAAR